MIPPLHVGEIVVPQDEAELVAHATLHKPLTDPASVRGMANFAMALLEERKMLWRVLAEEYRRDPVAAELSWPKQVVARLDEMGGDRS